MLLFKQITWLLIAIKLIKCNNAQNATDCIDSCSGNYTERTCFCTDCDLYNDCCTTNQSDWNKHMKYSNFECNIKTSDFEYTYSVVSCRNGWSGSGHKESSSIQNNCENPKNSRLINHVPVFSRETNLTYRNVYCAKCNIPDLSMETIDFYKYRPRPEEITSNSNFTEIILKNKNPIFKLDNGLPTRLRKCIPAINTCPEDSDLNEKAECRKHTAYVKSKSNKTYRNIYCALCNKELDSDLECYPVYSRKPIPFSTLRTNLGILVDISNLDLKEVIRQIFTDDEIESDQNIKLTTPSLDTNSVNYSELAKKYLTIIGLFVSIISILALLVIYCSNEALRNFPGMLLICLSVSILFSQSAFLVSSYLTEPITKLDSGITINQFTGSKQLLNEMFKPCYVFGFMMHFFYLATFSWSNIMGFDLYRMFAVLISSSRVDDQEQRKIRFKKYSVYGWLLPAFIVGSLVTKQFMTEKVAYGFDKCYITETIDILIFFLIPIALILFVNFIFLVLTIRSIIKVDKMTKSVLLKETVSKPDDAAIEANQSKFSYFKKIFSKKAHNEAAKNEKQRFVLFIKLFFLTGMTWVLGLLTASNKDSVLGYFYILFNSLQGFFIFLSFAFNTQTKRELKKTSFYRTFSSAMSKKSEDSTDGNEAKRKRSFKKPKS